MWSCSRKEKRNLTKTPLFLLFSFLLLSQAGLAQWRNQTDRRGQSPVFSQFKYYSFYSKNLSGHFAYAQLSPYRLNKFYVSGLIIKNGIQYMSFQTLDGDCVQPDPQNTQVNVCDYAGIKNETSQGLNIYNYQGRIRWNMDLEKSDLHGKVPGYNLKFPNSEKFESLLPFDWSISWQPVDPAMKMSGRIWIDGVETTVTEQTAYHDDTWGNWNFLSQPYFWVYVPASEEADKKFQLILGDFYFNKADRFAGITLLMDGKQVRYRPQDYVTKILKAIPIGSLPVNLFGKHETFHLSTMEDLKNRPATHRYPSDLSVETRDGKIKLRLHVSAIAPYLAKAPVVKSAYGDVWHDEMVIRVNYEIMDSQGIVHRGQSVGGMEFFQTKAIGLPLEF